MARTARGPLAIVLSEATGDTSSSHSGGSQAGFAFQKVTFCLPVPVLACPPVHTSAASSCRPQLQHACPITQSPWLPKIERLPQGQANKWACCIRLRHFKMSCCHENPSACLVSLSAIGQIEVRGLKQLPQSLLFLPCLLNLMKLMERISL